MLGRLFRSRVMVGVVCAALGATIAGGFALAAIPNGNTINACRNNTTFVLRVIDKDLGQTCTSSETALSWTNWKWRGTYSSSATYKVGDVVQAAGSSYLAKGPTAPPVGVGPTNTTYWAVVASKGDVGPAGPPGAPAPVSGTARQFAQTNVTFDFDTPAQLGPVDTSDCTAVSGFVEIAPNAVGLAAVEFSSWVPGYPGPLGFIPSKLLPAPAPYTAFVVYPLVELTGGNNSVWTVGPSTGLRVIGESSNPNTAGVVLRAGIYCIPRL